ncbi:Zinc phosphodiesterase ELAC protein 2 [Actinomortierella wolfii]|nr:Zinc phosphodiesterase ELAC protein 2 [Actinomortierella wolfii]
MKAYLQILSNGTVDCRPSLILHFDSQRYMINCSEGTQRLCMESKMRFSKLKTIFFTRTHWDCAGGVPGMLLTLSDVGARNIKLIGGENLTHLITSTRHFVYRNTMAVETLELSNQGSKTYKDENLRVTAVHLYPEGYERPTDPLPPPRDTVLGRSRHRSRSRTPPNQHHEGGQKRRSGDLSASEVGEASMEVDDPATIRKLILADMFNLSRYEATNSGDKQQQQKSGQPSNKRRKNSRNGGVPAAADAAPNLSEMDAIEAAEQAASSSSKDCGHSPPRIIRRPYQDLPRTRPDPAAITYIFQTPDYPGKFNKDEAIRLGIMPGPLFGQLVSGKPVQNQKGETVYPHQVIGGGRPGRVVVVVDCPSVEYIASLASAKEFKPYHSGEAQASCVVHMVSQEILNHPTYQTWMAAFGDATQHIMAHQDFCGERLIWRSQSVGAVKLSKLSKTIFPVPYYNNSPEADLASIISKNTDSDAGNEVKAIPSESMLKYHLEPSTGIDRGEVIPPLILQDYLDDEELLADKEYLKEYVELANKAHEEIEAEKQQLAALSIPGREVVVTALGTGSSHPSKYRNVSATLITMENDKSSHQEQQQQERDRPTFLLDVGEGTFGQMYRHFGGFRRSAEQVVSVDDRIKNLKGIFVSHLHADHHLGIVTVLDRWNKLREPDSTLYLVAPLRFNTFLQELSDVQDFGYNHVRFIDSENIVYWRSNTDHRRLASEDAYSGDTRPCNNLVEAGMGATVLLHEATFEDDMVLEARNKNHSTTSEAIRVGEGMNAQFTLLTHFSQRYPKIPRFDYQSRQLTPVHSAAGEEGEGEKPTVEGKMPVGLCFDLMSVKLGEIPLLPKFLPALEALYSPQSDEAQEEQLDNEDGELAALSKSTI